MIDDGGRRSRVWPGDNHGAGEKPHGGAEAAFALPATQSIFMFRY
jgi:hypothetical protein